MARVVSVRVEGVWVRAGGRVPVRRSGALAASALMAGGSAGRLAPPWWRPDATPRGGGHATHRAGCRFVARRVAVRRRNGNLRRPVGRDALSLVVAQQ